jgi:hypothetical protein
MADNLQTHKYFQKIWPNNTREKCEEAVENYIYEIIYNRVFKVDEDSEAFAM